MSGNVGEAETDDQLQQYKLKVLARAGSGSEQHESVLWLQKGPESGKDIGVMAVEENRNRADCTEMAAAGGAARLEAVFTHKEPKQSPTEPRRRPQGKEPRQVQGRRRKPAVGPAK